MIRTVEEAVAENSFADIIGCDPGPEASALVLVRVGPKEAELRGALYLPNARLTEGVEVWDRLGCPAGPVFLAYEKVGLQGKYCGDSTFETAAMGGEIRRLFRPFTSGCYAMVSSDWRYALTGQGNARTPMVYAAACQFFPATGAGSDPCKGTKAAPGPLWELHQAGAGGKVEHLKDALGVALGLTRVRYRAARDPEEYRRPF